MARDLVRLPDVVGGRFAVSGDKVTIGMGAQAYRELSSDAVRLAA